jgi:hypothetical protein
MRGPPKHMSTIHQIAHGAVHFTNLYPYLKTTLLAVAAGLPDAEPFHHWESSDGMVRCSYDYVVDGYHVDADEDHQRADLITVLDLLESRGYEPHDDPMEDEVLDDGTVRVYFVRTADILAAA